MNEKSLKNLEYHKITEMLASRAASPMGKEMCRALLPMTVLEDITQAQGETTAATSLILKKGSLPLGGISDIRGALARALAGGMLAPEELVQVSDFLYVCGKLINYGRRSEESAAGKRFGETQGVQTAPPSDLGNTSGDESLSVLRAVGFQPLYSYFDAISPAKNLENEITRCINPSGEIHDNASPKLSDLRRNIRVSHDRIREHLQKVVQSAAYKNMLQDAIVTRRGDRFCVPVKAEHRGSFPGLVHDQSSTGATGFMEPSSVVDLNNKIKDLHFEEKREEERILFRLSGLVADEGELLRGNFETIAHLDFVFAKGELSLQMKASEPLFNNKGYVNLRKARHPLLNRDTAVPIDVFLGNEFYMLLITGPNTGGKTVTLKTVGLFVLMGQAGLHIPAFENSELAVFWNVFSDIGDEQSIEQSLSTFSSHMKNIVNILEEVGPKSLVLLDELGAGTDPTEGAALAIALLSHLHAKQITTIVTTHYSELKLYALSTKGVENASCEFDVETLRPTYRLLIGIPGKSNAFAIAKRLGLRDDIINSAKELLGQKDIRFEDVITDLEASKKAVILEEERAAAFRREAEKLRADVAKQEESLRTNKEKLMAQARSDALKLVADIKKEADELVGKMRKQLEATSGREFEEARKTLKDGLQAIEDSAMPEKPKREPPKNLRRGDTVFIHSMNQTGTVSQVADTNGDVLIQAGIMKIKVHVTDLSLAESDPGQKAADKIKAGRSSRGTIIKALEQKREIDLRGMIPEEAVSAADKYLDDAFLSGMSNVTIIHGKGTGAVRTAIHNMLKRHPHAKEFRLGSFGEGEDGVTVVSLK